jgi:hypothetical protein
MVYIGTRTFDVQIVKLQYHKSWLAAVTNTATALQESWPSGCWLGLRQSTCMDDDVDLLQQTATLIATMWSHGCDFVWVAQL